MTAFCYIVTILFLRFLFSFSFASEDNQTRKTVFNHISKHLEVRQKYSAARHIFNRLLGLLETLANHGISCLM